MKMISVAIVLVLATSASAQTESTTVEDQWAESLNALNSEYFEKLRTLQSEHIKLLEALKTEATKNDRLDDAIKLRDRIETFTADMGNLALPEDNSKLAKEKARLASILKQSKWDCSANPNLPKWAGTHLVFHENGTIVPASDQNAKVPHHRWAILDGQTIVGMFGDYQIVFRLNAKANALEVLEIGNVIDATAKRHGYVVQSPAMTRSVRDKK